MGYLYGDCKVLSEACESACDISGTVSVVTITFVNASDKENTFVRVTTGPVSNVSTRNRLLDTQVNLTAYSRIAITTLISSDASPKTGIEVILEAWKVVSSRTCARYRVREAVV